MEDYFMSRPIKSEPDYRKFMGSAFSGWLDNSVGSISRKDVEKRYQKPAFEEGYKAQAAKAVRCLSVTLNFALV